VVEDARFQDTGLQDWAAGSILIVGTDGLRETMNSQGEMFGRERLRDLIRRNAGESAEGIQTAVIESLHGFRGEVPRKTISR